jgi:hypothetical protein
VPLIRSNKLQGSTVWRSNQWLPTSTKEPFAASLSAPGLALDSAPRPVLGTVLSKKGLGRWHTTPQPKLPRSNQVPLGKPLSFSTNQLQGLDKRHCFVLTIINQGPRRKGAVCGFVRIRSVSSYKADYLVQRTPIKRRCDSMLFLTDIQSA